LAETAVSCEGVSVRFTSERGTVTALQSIDLTIARGSFLTLLGPSGCGKSTLLRVMADLVAPTSGRVSVMGGAPQAARESRQIGFVFQDPALLAWRTVLDNVSLPLQVGGGKALPGARSPQELLSLVGLTGSPRLVSMAESIVAELRLALAQIDRVRRNARDQAGSHHHLLDLLEGGDIDAAVAELGEHLHGAEEAIIERLDLA